jgi:tetratricopeptide (TPR) repeat protein
MKQRLFPLLALMFTCSAYAASYEDYLPCEPLSPDQTYHDINDPRDHVLLGTVESNHFLPQVETLQKGQSSTIQADIAFVLRAFPNHYRALNAMARWQLRNKLPLDNSIWTADCYFLRAQAFRPDDWKVRFVYGIYLHAAKRLDEADRAYAAAAERGADTPDFYYDRGLLNVDLGRLDLAQQDADKAYEMGHPLPGLRDKLARARKQSTPVKKAAPPQQAQTEKPGQP